MTLTDLSTHLQYRILKRIAPREPACVSGEFYAGKSKLRVLLGDEFVNEIRGKFVIDFGSGDGAEAVEMAQIGAAEVMGVEIREAGRQAAVRRAREAGVAERCQFVASASAGQADAIVSLDSFEHFANPEAILATMHDLLKPGGLLLTSFGPTWFHPYGGHLVSVFPWAHLIFSERALMRWRSDIRSDGATRFRDVEGGLNQMTIKRFERMMKQSPFLVDRIEAVPIRRLRPFHFRLTREWTTSIVRARLRKRNCR
jgi:SAM-dependent methyltransferase